MKIEGYYHGIPVYSSPDVPEGEIYLLNDNYRFEYPRRKDGGYDMRYKINRLHKLLKII